MLEWCQSAAASYTVRVDRQPGMQGSPGQPKTDLVVPQQQVKHTPCRASNARFDATM